MTIYIVDIEPVETRYTKQWREHLPAQLRANTNHDVVSISGSMPHQTIRGHTAVVRYASVLEHGRHSIMSVGPE